MVKLLKVSRFSLTRPSNSKKPSNNNSVCPNQSGAAPGGGHGATMTDDDEEYDSDYGAFDQNMDYHDSGGYGPLVPTETERTLMERVRQELKHELKQARVISLDINSVHFPLSDFF